MFVYAIIQQENLANAKVSGPHLGSPSNINVICTSLKSTFSAQQCGIIFIRLAVVASQTCQGGRPAIARGRYS